MFDSFQRHVCVSSWLLHHIAFLKTCVDHISFVLLQNFSQMTRKEFNRVFNYYDRVCIVMSVQLNLTSISQCCGLSDRPGL